MRLASTKKTPLIFIYGGKFPKYGKYSILFNNKYSKMDLILLCNKEDINFKISRNIRVFDYNEFNDNTLFFLKQIRKLNKFRSSFWILSIERYFVLLNFVKKLKINNFFHGELDNVFFNLLKIDNKLNKIGKKIFFPVDNQNGFGSIIYINSIKILEKFCEFSLKKLKKNFYNDMKLLYLFGKKFPHLTKFLPTEKSLFFKKKNTINYKSTQGIFDGARIGQYLFGVDPRNIRNKLYNKIIIEEKKTIKKKLSKYYNNCRFYFNDKKFYLKFYKKKVNIFNLHIHSKLIEEIFFQKNYKKILNDVNNKKSNYLVSSSKFTLNKVLNFLKLR